MSVTYRNQTEAPTVPGTYYARYYAGRHESEIYVVGVVERRLLDGGDPWLEAVDLGSDYGLPLDQYVWFGAVATCCEG